VSENATTYSGSNPDACCLSAEQWNQDGMKTATTTTLQQQQQRCVSRFLSVEQIYSSSRFYFQLRIADWYSRDLGIDPSHYRNLTVPGRSSFLLLDSVAVVRSLSSDPDFSCFSSFPTLHWFHVRWLIVSVLVDLLRCRPGGDAQVLNPSCLSLLQLFEVSHCFHHSSLCCVDLVSWFILSYTFSHSFLSCLRA
jgi:hypothetical protein